MGEAGAGKDTVADFINDLSDKHCNIFKYGDAVRKVASVLYNIPIESFTSQEGKAEYNAFWGATNRELLQFVGTDLVRNKLNRNHWVNLASQTLESMHDFSAEVNLLATDCRFKNEYELLEGFAKAQNIPIKYVNVSRPANPWKLPLDEASHESENYTHTIEDYVIHVINSGSIKHFKKQIKDKLLPELFK